MDNIKKFILFLGAMVIEALIPHAKPKDSEKTAFDFSFKTLGGDPMPLAAYKGKAILLVNTASECGFTPQYKGLQELYTDYLAKGLVVVGVPSNDFGAQEPGNAQEIKQFCEINYGVTFPMAGKEVVSGPGAHPFYRWAAEILAGSAPKWNFHKYLIGRDGRLVDYFPSTVAPDSAKLIAAIEKVML